jgi:creatinine amidohydrolase
MAWDTTILRVWLERSCMEFHRLGFRGIVMLTGHYGHNQQITVRETAVRMSQRLRMPVLGTPEYFLAQDAGYVGDHAGVGETSLLMHLHPDLVDLKREDGEFNAADSSAEIGAKYTQVICTRLAAFSKVMPSMSAAQLDDFIAAEHVLVSVLTRLWREHAPWRAWQNLNQRQQFGYGAALAKLDFAAIRQLGASIA